MLFEITEKEYIGIMTARETKKRIGEFLITLIPIAFLCIIAFFSNNASITFKWLICLFIIPCLWLPIHFQTKIENKYKNDTQKT